MSLKKLLVFVYQVVNDKSIGNVVHQTQPEGPDYQLEKLIVVLFSDAVVQISTVVVEP